MNNFNKKLNDIISGYFDSSEINNDQFTLSIIGNAIKKNSIGKKFVIWGAGEHTEELYKYFSVELKDASYIIDNNKKAVGTKFLGYDVVSPDRLKNDSIDTIFISSYSASNIIMKQIKEMDLKCKVINFYNELERGGIKLTAPFYNTPSYYVELYELQTSYNNCSDENEKEKLIRKIILTYLKIRDIENSIEYIKKYINLKYINCKEFEGLLLEIKSLVKEMKNELNKRKGKDIILFFLDSLRAKDVFGSNPPMKYLNSIANEGIAVKKAYSPSIFTYESIPAVLTGQRPFENDLYKRKVINEEESKFIRKAIENNFKIKIFCIGYWNIIDGEHINQGQNSYYAPQVMWNALCDLLDNENDKNIYLLYFAQETHPPHIGGKHSVEPKGHVTPFTCNDVIEQSKKDYIKQYKESLIYVDEQIKYYFDIIPSNTTKVIFSDHGQIVERAIGDIKDIGTLAGWHTDRYSIPLIVLGDNIPKINNNNLYSMLNFGDLMEGLIEDKINLINSEVVEVNFSKVNNDIIIQKYKKCQYEDYLYGFKVFLNYKNKLVVTGNNKIKVYSNEDEFNEIIDEDKRREIINEFINQGCNFDMPDWK